MQNGNQLSGVFVQTNERDGNRVIAFRRNGDGALSGLTSHETGGSGDGVPHLTSQGSVVLSGDGRRLLVTNSGSDEISVFAAWDGDLSLVTTVASGGSAPKSVAERDGLVYVLNTGTPSLNGFRLEESGLRPLPNAIRELPAGADPAQVGFTPDGSALLVTDRGSDSLLLFAVGDDGSLDEPRVVPSPGPTPYGFTFAGERALVVTEAFGAQKGKAAASSYAFEGGTATPVSRSVGNGRSEICWAVATGDGRYVFTTNFADGAVSRYALGDDGSISLEDATAGTAVEGQPGLRDEDITSDGRFLYAIDADGHQIFGWAIGESGELSPVGSWGDVPATVAGLAAS
jgi:6-phosphogluconolactonase (cycloisomerase 2 family)